jgi:hypothetical protein
VKQIENGLFAVEETMPCNPQDIRVGRYDLPDTLQRAEREEAAARIITFSQQVDSWVGVSWSRLAQMMREEFEEQKRWNDVRRQNHQEEWRFAAAMRKYRIRCIATLGLYALFATKPVKNLREVPLLSVPSTGIFICGPKHVIEGLRELVELGMLKHVQEGDGDTARDIFVPTPILISTIMQKQQPATA